jgi:hypothetical protein
MRWCFEVIVELPDRMRCFECHARDEREAWERVQHAVPEFDPECGRVYFVRGALAPKGAW